MAFLDLQMLVMVNLFLIWLLCNPEFCFPSSPWFLTHAFFSWFFYLSDPSFLVSRMLVAVVHSLHALYILDQRLSSLMCD